MIGPEGCSRGDGEDGRNLGSISKQEPAGVDNKGDRGNGSLRTKFSGKTELFSFKFLLKLGSWD